MGDNFALDRFVRAQAGVYPTALAELQAGAKRSHWMWFVFPQIRGLGTSKNARFFAISGATEAHAYVIHQLLGARLRQATAAMLDWVGRKEALEILGPIDGLKFHSSMTLFEATGAADDAALFAKALDGFFHGRRDTATLTLLEAGAA